MQGKKKHRSLRVLLRSFCILLALVLLAAAALFLIPLTETVSVKTMEGSADWMSRLDDGLRLNEIVIPGTHDSATRYSQLAFITKCQALSIEEQLEAGYRYLDIRLGFSDTGEQKSGKLKLMHGFTNCRKGPMPWEETLYLNDVLEQCIRFLKAHPTETVIFAVKYEHITDSVEQFERCLNEQMKLLDDMVLLTDSIPSLGEARGKLVLARRYRDDAGLGGEAGLFLSWSDQKDHEDVSQHVELVELNTVRLWVQDRFSYGTEDKWNAFQNGLRESRIEKQDLSIHFLSTKGTAAYGHPFHYAKALNPRLMDLARQELRGWIIVDFGSAELAEHIWSANFQ